MRIIIFFLLFTVTAFAQQRSVNTRNSSANEADGRLMAGTAKINISPTVIPENRMLHDSLYARSLILQWKDTRIAFFSIDVSGYNDIALLNKLKKDYQLNELYFCISHSNTGSIDRSGGALNRTVIESQITAIIKEASENMFEAKISAGHRTTPQLTFNRLIIRDDGHAREAWYADPEDHFRYLNKERIPFGPVDPTVGIIRIDDSRNRPRAVIMNFACHPDALNAVSYVISSDYVGSATRFVEEAFDYKVNCLFIQGGAGNQASLFKTPHGGEKQENYFDAVARMGKLLGIEATILAKELFPNPNLKASIKLKTDSMDIPNRFDDDVAKIYFSTILINDKYAIATCPGEPFIKFQLDWKREMGPYVTPFFFGYTWNGGKWPTYLPDIRSAALGGYGADWGPTRAPCYGEAIIAKHIYNYYDIIGLMRKTQGPSDHRLDDGTVR